MRYKHIIYTEIVCNLLPAHPAAIIPSFSRVVIPQAFGLINFLAESHVMFPILPVYNCFLRTCAKRQSTVHVSQCLDLMDHRMVGKNEATYSELLKVCKEPDPFRFYKLYFKIICFLNFL